MRAVDRHTGKFTPRLNAGRAGLRGAILPLLWLAVVAVGAHFFLIYETTPGADGVPPARWPAASSIRHNPDGFTLLLFVHPRCPCTHATLDELAEVLTRHPRGLTAHVIFCKPPGAPDAWERTELWERATALPSVRIWRDEDGAESRRFHAQTSGQALLYDADCRLLFRGGITPIRGQAGPNEGRNAILDLLRHGIPERMTTPVFGCPLFDSPCPTEGLDES